MVHFYKMGVRFYANIIYNLAAKLSGNNWLFSGCLSVNSWELCIQSKLFKAQ